MAETKKHEYSLAEAIDLYDEFREIKHWVYVIGKINTALPKKKAIKWNKLEKLANQDLNECEKEMIDAVDGLSEEDLDKFRSHYGL